MHHLASRARARMRGFTLIELMIVVVIVGIIVAIAYPSYQAYVQRARRADGKAALMDTAQRLERCYTRFGAYNDGGCDVAGDLPFASPEGFYAISAGALSPASFTLVATPQAAQAADTRCGVLQLTNAGEQGSEGDSDDDAGCW